MENKSNVKASLQCKSSRTNTNGRSAVITSSASANSRNIRSRVTSALANTVDLLKRLFSTPVLIVSTPLGFTSDYSELTEPVGILKTVKEMGAFKAGTKGAETSPELRRFGERNLEVPGKR